MNTTDKQYLQLLESILETLQEIRDAQNMEEEEPTTESAEELPTQTLASFLEERKKRRVQGSNPYVQENSTTGQYLD